MEYMDMPEFKLIIEAVCKDIQKYLPDYTMDYIIQQHLDKGYVFLEEYVDETLGRIVKLREPEDYV